MLPQVAPVDAETAAVTKAVVAICVVFVPGVAVGAAGVPVKVGLARLALRLSAVVTKAVVASFRDESPADWVTPFVMPWSVVVEVPVVEPMAMFVVEPATPAVPMLTVLVVAVRVAPVARLSVDAAVVPPIEVVEAPRTGPMVVFVVEPTTPPVPMFRVLVEALMVAPEATPIVPVAVELP
jgi:hypothetical protein